LVIGLSGKMAKRFGFLKIRWIMKHTTKIQRTRILPLRWIGNFLGEYAGNHLVKAIDLDEDENYGWRYKYHSKMWTILNKPYELWGTYYLLDMKAIKKGWDQN